MAAAHRFRDEVAAHPAGRRCRHRSREEEPDVRPVARPRALNRHRNTERFAGLDERGNVVDPGLLIEVRSEEPAVVVLEQRICPHHMAPLQVVDHHLIAQRDEGLVRTFSALHPWLLADSPNPLVGAGRGIALPAGATVHPVFREDILAAPEEAAKEADLLGRGGRYWRGGRRNGEREVLLQRP